MFLDIDEYSIVSGIVNSCIFLKLDFSNNIIEYSFTHSSRLFVIKISKELGDKLVDKLSNQKRLVKIKGFNNTFYFIDQYRLSDFSIFELGDGCFVSFNFKNAKFKIKLKECYSIISILKEKFSKELSLINRRIDKMLKNNLSEEDYLYIKIKEEL